MSLFVKFSRSKKNQVRYISHIWKKKSGKYGNRKIARKKCRKYEKKSFPTRMTLNGRIKAIRHTRCITPFWSNRTSSVTSDPLVRYPRIHTYILTYFSRFFGRHTIVKSNAVVVVAGRPPPIGCCGVRVSLALALFTTTLPLLRLNT